MAKQAKARRAVSEETVREALGTISGSAQVRVPSNGNSVERLRSSLDTMDERIKLLLARHDDLAERCVAATEAQREAEQQLARFTSGELDPRQLETRTQDLETENERLARHVAYLEERIESLLMRVRYVVE